MGTVTSLSGITVSSAENASGASYGEDITGMMQCAQTKAQELIYMLNSISSRLPNGDPNIAAINTLVTNLS